MGQLIAHTGDTVRTAMTAPVVALDPGTVLRAAAQVLRRHDIGAAVVEDAGRFVGMLSERDLVQAVADGLDFDRERVGSVMTDSPRPVDADSPLWAATIVMLRHGIRHLPVTDENRIVGMLSIRDALAVSDQDRIVGPSSGGLLDA
jgi:CBS domain-containing protein